MYQVHFDIAQEHNPKLGKAKKHPAYCVFVAYRLVKRLDGASDVSTLSATPTSLIEDDLNLEDDFEVLEELEDKQLTNRLETLEHENKSLKEEVAKLEHGRSWLEEGVGVLENVLKNAKFSHKVEDQSSNIDPTVKTVI